MANRYKAIVMEKLNEFNVSRLPPIFKRDLSLGPILPPKRSNLAQVIVGVRRCGKTYRLYQEMQRVVEEGCDPKSILYFNFDDDRLKPYDSTLLNEVVECFFARNPAAKQTGAFFFFDEIQEVPEWGPFLRRMVDTEDVTMYVTGSSSKMLSVEIATEFRGRALSRELFPMSFSEYLRFHGCGISESHAEGVGALPAPSFVPSCASLPEAPTSEVRAQLRYGCERYLLQGGFIATQNLEPADSIQLLQEYATRTVNYDVIERSGISNAQAASLFLARCIASSGRELSINKLHNEFRSRGISVSRETLSRLLAYYEEAYLLFPVRNHSVALADNARSTAKVYAVDPALFGAFSPAMSRDAGQRLETAVFDKLRRVTPTSRVGAISRANFMDGGKKHEIDFVVGDELAFEEPQLIQVCLSLEDALTRKREVSALEAGMRRFGLGASMIVTLDDEETIETPQGIIHVTPAWKWLY